MRMYVNVELYEDFARFYCLFGYGNNAWSIRVERWLDSITEYQAVTMSTIPSEPVVVGLTNGTHEWRWQSWMPDSDGKKYTTTKIWLMKNDCALVTWYIWILLLRPQMCHFKCQQMHGKYDEYGTFPHGCFIWLILIYSAVQTMKRTSWAQNIRTTKSMNNVERQSTEKKKQYLHAWPSVFANCIPTQPYLQHSFVNT